MERQGRSDTAPRLISGREVQARTSLSRATIWRRVRAGLFPRPVSLGTNRIAWVEDSVSAWIAGRSSTSEGA